MGLLGEAASAGLGLALEGHNDRRQYFQQKKLQELQMRGQKEMTEFNRGQAMKMWEDTNYAAQVAQMRKANLNVGLMYNGQGAGGSTQITPGSVTGASAEGQKGEIGLGMQLGLQKAMQEAQIKLTEAQTEKTKVETQKTAGVDTTKTGSEIKNLEVQNVILQHEERMKEIAARVQKGTEQEQIDAMKNANAKTEAEIKSAEAQGTIDKATADDRIQQVKAATIEQQLRIAAQKAGIDNTTINSEQMKKAIQVMAAQINNMGIEQAQNWVRLDQTDRERWVKEAQLKLNEKGIEFQTGSAPSIKQWVDIISPVLGPGAMLLK